MVASPKTWTSDYAAFHIRNETPLRVESFPTREGVARPKTVPHDEWVEIFQREASKPDTTNPLAPLRLFVAKGELAHLPHFDQSRTREMLGARWNECPAYHIDL